MTYSPAALGLPAVPVVVVTCLDHRVDPAIVLGLELGDAPVIRNAGGRVTPAVIDDIAYLAFLAEQWSGGRVDTLFEVAVIHHTQCGTAFLADPGFRQRAAEATGLSEVALEASAVADPQITVKADVERLLDLTVAVTQSERLGTRVRHHHRTRRSRPSTPATRTPEP